MRDNLRDKIKLNNVRRRTFSAAYYNEFDLIHRASYYKSQPLLKEAWHIIKSI